MKTTLEHSSCGSYWIGRFDAMASPCEVLIEVEDQALAQRVLQQVAQEASRIEAKFSRYRKDNVVYRINHSHGQPVEVDEETALLLNYAELCFQLSEGMFDITAGVLRHVWSFKPGALFPRPKKVKECLTHIGWSQVSWKAPSLTLPKGMEIDLGGIGKEYAVDKAAQLAGQTTDASFVINFGGDLYVNKPRQGGQPWYIAIDDPEATGVNHVGQLEVRCGGVATSGDARRYLLHKGKRYSHILNPRTGYPIEGAPRSATVVANSCMEAGMLATFAMLHGAQARDFLEGQQVPFRIID
jgi:thiamine biosynthesis lipoprotein